MAGVIRAVLAVLVTAAMASSLSFDMQAAKNRPVSKVINLLKDMLKQLEKEAENDEEIYDKMACWCETNERIKKKSIADAEVRIEQLKSKVEELVATAQRLESEIKEAEKEVSANQQALNKATTIREEQLKEFNAEEKDLLESISALKAALTVLGKHNPQPGAAAFLQMPQGHLAGVAATLKREMQKHDSLLKGVLTHSERRVATSFIQSPMDSESYAPQSGEIFGILSSMKDSFEENLATSQKEEAANQKAYEELKKAKEEEIAAGQAQIDKKTQELADTNEKCAHAKEDIEDTEETKAADEKYLAMLKEKCSMTDGEWEERQKTRQMEIEACSKALGVLSTDDAHDLFSKTFNFLQKTDSKFSVRRTQASKLLAEVAKKVNSRRLSSLATRVKLDAFTKVKKAIDDMVVSLLKEKEDEIKHKDFCVAEFNTNQLQTEKKEREKADLEAKIQDLETTIKDLKEAIATLQQEIKDMKVAMKRASETREIENAEFAKTVTDQRETQKLLGLALGILEGFYKATPKPIGLLQDGQEPAGPPPPAGFDAYKKNEQSSGVMQMIEMIMADAKEVEAEAVRAEQDAQKAYESLVQESNQGIEAKTEDIANKSEEKAKLESELVEKKEAKEGVVLELEELSQYNAELHTSCDFVMKNFDIRQSARDQEIEALKQAKAILSGAKFEEFLEQS